MNKYLICVLSVVLSFGSYAGDKRFLTVDELIDNGYSLMPGEQMLELMRSKTIKVVDIETDAVLISKHDKSDVAMERKFVETKTEKSSSLFDVRLLARAPALDGKIEREVVGDELVSTNGVRTYRYRLYRKQERIFAVRDIDNGNVFLEVK